MRRSLIALYLSFVGMLSAQAQKEMLPLHEWGEPISFGPATTMQFLDDPGSAKPEHRHFGEIR